jgi:N-acetyl-anhydromuramyl-L-alanine amidase AmpD
MTEVLAPLEWMPSPNHSSRNGHAITHLVWHATIGEYVGSCEWLCNPAADASAHLVVREDGDETTQLVRLHDKAWHAFPYWNLRSVGVEHASLTQGFAEHAQLVQSARLFGWLCVHLGIPPVHGLHKPKGIVRHRDLGAAGGSHHDGPSDGVWFNDFLPAVRSNIAGGGYRKVYAR